MKHTEGPWKLRHGNIYGPRGDQIILDGTDGALIAAAPDLLAALEYIAAHSYMARTCANETGRIKSLENIIDRAQAAIAKARGES